MLCGEVRSQIFIPSRMIFDMCFLASLPAQEAMMFRLASFHSSLSLVVSGIHGCAPVLI
jgi:uncharacterized MAPEG superfamily protein